jgi:CRISPR-associated exonuclease Cas4
MVAATMLFVYAARTRSIVRAEKRSHGVPEGLILYSDLNVPASPLFSKRFRLSGKPDYIVRRENHVVPVEVKTGHGSSPHQSQILQLAAYCQILEDVSGSFVPEGILVYNSVPYTIPFNPQLRFELEIIMRAMRASLRSGAAQRNHDKPRRCHYCSMKRYCTDVLTEEP